LGGASGDEARTTGELDARDRLEDARFARALVAHHGNLGNGELRLHAILAQLIDEVQQWASLGLQILGDYALLLPAHRHCKGTHGARRANQSM